MDYKKLWFICQHLSFNIPRAIEISNICSVPLIIKKDENQEWLKNIQFELPENDSNKEHMHASLNVSIKDLAHANSKDLLDIEVLKDILYPNAKKDIKANSIFLLKLLENDIISISFNDRIFKLHNINNEFESTQKTVIYAKQIFDQEMNKDIDERYGGTESFNDLSKSLINRAIERKAIRSDQMHTLNKVAYAIAIYERCDHVQIPAHCTAEAIQYLYKHDK